ncbi:MAG: hypothetical protein WC325_11625 [Candidatus Bathyarchaeia archaeon]|jgi:hypothetical protein
MESKKPKTFPQLETEIVACKQRLYDENISDEDRKQTFALLEQLSSELVKKTDALVFCPRKMIVKQHDDCNLYVFMNDTNSHVNVYAGATKVERFQGVRIEPAHGDYPGNAVTISSFVETPCGTYEPGVTLLITLPNNLKSTTVLRNSTIAETEKKMANLEKASQNQPSTEADA